MGPNRKKPSKNSNNSKILFLSILLAISFRNMGLSIIEIGLPNFILSLSGSIVSFGLVIGIYSVMQSLFQFPFAALSDKYGRKIILFFGILIYAIGTFLCYFSQDIIQLIIFRAIQGIGAYTSILQAMIGDLFSSKEQGKGMGYYSLSLNVGYFGGIILGGYLTSLLNFRLIFLINGILIVLSAIVLFIVFRFKKNNAKDDTQLLILDDENKNKFTLNRYVILKLMKKRSFSIIIGINSIRWFIFGGIVVYLIWVLQVHFRQTEFNSSLILIIIVAIYLLFVIISSYGIDKYGSRKMMLIGQSIVLILVIPFILQIIHNFWIFIVVSCLMSMGLALYDPAGNTLLLNNIEKINPDLKGSGIGINNAIGFFFSSLSPIIICPLGEFYVFLPFYLLIVLVLVAFILTIKFLK